MAVTYIDQIAERVRSALPPQSRPSEQADELYRLYALLVLVRGEETTLEDVHDAWSTWMSGLNSSHRSLRPFRELDPDTQAADGPYLLAIKTVAREGRPSGRH